MTEYTDNYGLNKYSDGDAANLRDQYNASMDIIDGKLKTASDNASYAKPILDAAGLTNITEAESSKGRWDGAATLAATNRNDIAAIDANLNALHAGSESDASALYNTIVGVGWNNLVSMGVDNTGVSDVSDKVNSIISGSNVDGIVFMPGVYKVSKSIKIPVNTTNPYSIFIMAGATIIADANGIDVFDIGSTTKNGDKEGFRIFGGGTIDGNWKASNGIHAASAVSKSTVSGITVNNCTLNAILFEKNGPVDSQFSDIKVNGDKYYNDTDHCTQNGINIIGTDWLASNLYMSSCKNFLILNGGAQIQNVHLFNSYQIGVDSTGFLVKKGFNQFANIYVDTIQRAIDCRSTQQPQYITNLQHYFYRAIGSDVIGIDASTGSQIVVNGYDWSYREDNTHKTTPIEFNNGSGCASDICFFAGFKDTGDFNFNGHTFETRAGGSAIILSEEVNLNAAGDGILIGYADYSHNPAGFATFVGTVYENAAYSFPQIVRFRQNGSSLTGGVFNTLGNDVTGAKPYLTLNGTTPVYVGIGRPGADGKNPVYLYNAQKPIQLVTKLFFMPAPGNRNSMIFTHAVHKTTGLTDEMMLFTSKNNV